MSAMEIDDDFSASQPATMSFEVEDPLYVVFFGFNQHMQGLHCFGSKECRDGERRWPDLLSAFDHALEAHCGQMGRLKCISHDKSCNLDQNKANRPHDDEVEHIELCHAAVVGKRIAYAFTEQEDNNCMIELCSGHRILTREEIVADNTFNKDILRVHGWKSRRDAAKIRWEAAQAKIKAEQEAAKAKAKAEKEEAEAEAKAEKEKAG
ncbi:hypothetical protein FPQ18DRAFT_393581 [Pyronema domesticum]|nr:hypothetical protein FPQ18DRAFT_393581 [Pyronema domesticum]